MSMYVLAYEATSGAMEPKTTLRMKFLPAYMTVIIMSDMNVTNTSSCSPASQDLSLFFCPRYCPATTAPPVAKAAKILIRRMFTESTSDTADTALSPTLATIIESAMPTATAKNCSITSGNNSCIKFLFVKIYSFFNKSFIIILSI
ncbi:hypothetical protein SDC9_74951 [bioreactor metagenome]|uniref:Uncharacterized protein n=1 Tax=bioreactor metagenome TaxID=1076179 RepID=A0A644YJA9_9ZZZZ